MRCPGSNPECRSRNINPADMDQRSFLTARCLSLLFHDTITQTHTLRISSYTQTLSATARGSLQTPSHDICCGQRRPAPIGSYDRGPRPPVCHPIPSSPQASFAGPQSIAANAVQQGPADTKAVSFCYRCPSFSPLFVASISSLEHLTIWYGHAGACQRILLSSLSTGDFSRAELCICRVSKPRTSPSGEG